MLGSSIRGYDMIQLTELSVVTRILLSTFCGCALGMERSRKLRAAGARTYALVCLGATIVMMTGQLLGCYVGQTDIARLGAQVISGIGFIGAGTIIVTGYHKVKGVTTAAGLWAAACMGLAIGAGFYFGGIVTCLSILFIITLLDRVQCKFVANGNRLRLFVVFEQPWDVRQIIQRFHENEMIVDDFEMIPIKSEDMFGVMFLIKSLKRRPHEKIVEILKSFQGVVMVEEM